MAQLRWHGELNVKLYNLTIISFTGKLLELKSEKQLDLQTYRKQSETTNWALSMGIKNVHSNAHKVLYLTFKVFIWLQESARFSLLR